MKRHTHEALLRHVLPSYIELDRAVAELDSLRVRDAVVGAFAEMNTGSRPVDEPRRGAVEDLQAIGVESPLLAGNARRGEEAGRSQQSGDGNVPVHDGSFRSGRS